MRLYFKIITQSTKDTFDYMDGLTIVVCIIMAVFA